MFETTDPDAEAAEAARAVLRHALVALTVDVTTDLLSGDLMDADRLALAEKRVRTLSVHRTTIEKIIMDDTLGPQTSTDDTDALRRELLGRLRRHADRLGVETLAERLRARGIDPASARVGPVGEDGPKTP